jgi:Ser/Thr protein kinase RdoA (MazF antagonist)
MSTLATEPQQTQEFLAGVHQLAPLPDWLIAIADPDRIREAMQRAIPEFAAGELTLLRCEARRARLKTGGWTIMYRLTVADRRGEGQREIALRGMLIPPGSTFPETPRNDQALGSDGWQGAVPELRLVLSSQPPEAALPALPILSDPEQARALLETSIRTQSPAYHDLRIQSCEPRVVRYKPGSRCTLLYRLAYASDARPEWPDIVVAKTYTGDEGQICYDGMRALWDSPLSTNPAVAIAEPLAFIPELNVLVQGPIRQEQTLKELLRSALLSGTPAALAELDTAMRKTAAGLAALHQTEVHTGHPRVWEDELAEVQENLDRLGQAIPSLADVAAPLIAHLRALSAAHPADTAVPTHGTFRPAQVLLHNGDIGFIDFDGFCQAEPALDVALFLGKIKDIGLSVYEENDDTAAPDPAALESLLAQTDAICASFLDAYESCRPISRQRIVLWESLDLLALVLNCWAKVKSARLPINMLMLERYLQAHAL